MSEGATHKATDEVLASIMRIVRSEKQLGAPAGDGSGDGIGGENPPLALTSKIRDKAPHIFVRGVKSYSPFTVPATEHTFRERRPRPG